MRPLTHGLVLSGSLVAAVALPACAVTSLPEPERPEIPSREEVFESERLHRPATPAAVKALRAYEAKVCVPADPALAQQTRRRRWCRGAGPLEEIRLLEELRKSEPRSADQPKIIERMIADWRDVGDLAVSECAPLRLGPTPTVQEVEDGLRAVYALERAIERSRTEPEKLCAELRDSYPNHVRHVRCPGDPPATGSPELSGSDWPISEPELPAEPRFPEEL